MNDLLRAAVLRAKATPPPDTPPAATPELEGLFGRLHFLETAINKILNELGISMLPHAQRPFPTIKKCITATALHYGCSVHDILGNTRGAANVGIRQTAMYIAKYLTLNSYAALGRFFDRDHTTVLHACRKIETMRKVDALLDKDIGDISRELLSGVQRDAPPGPAVGSLHPLQAVGPTKNDASLLSNPPGASLEAVAEPSPPSPATASIS